MRWALRLGCGFLAAVAAADGEAPTGKAKLEALFENIAQAQAHVRTLMAHFEQTKVSHLLKEPSVARGVFYYQAPDQIRWEYQEPRPVVVFMTSRAMVTYRPEERLAERLELGRQQRKVFTFFSANEPLSNLSRHFSFTLRDAGEPAPYVLVLTPVTHQIKKRLRSVELVVERATYLPSQVTYTEADGDVTTYRFSHVAINGPLPDGLFALDLPAGVRVVELKLRGAQ